jgi:DNA-binding transcriptional ArsR family regulator
MARAATTTDAFNALGDASRRQILDALALGEATVGEIVMRLDLPQPQISKHLKVLRDVDLVRCRREGRRRVYRMHRPALQPVQLWLQQLTAALNEHYDRLDDYLVELQQTGPTERKDRTWPHDTARQR